jgi:Putative Flp pilus-assembly TadE/G-like
MLTRMKRNEDGAVAVMVAVSLVVLIGMLVLTVDLGRVWTVRRKLSTGSDAAALAAAQECAMGNGSASARAAGVSVGQANEDGTYTLNISPECDTLANKQPKLVTASSSQDVDLIFAGIFGIDTLPASGTATAQWGPIVSANPIPITVNYDALVGCGIPFEPPPPGETKQCEITYPKDQFSEPAWGILSLGQWNRITASTGCHVSNSEVVSIIEAGGWPGDQVPLNDPPYDPATGQGNLTYDCIDNGLQFSSWDALVGGTLTFPVVDIPTSVTGTSPVIEYQNDPNCAPTATTSQLNHCKISNPDVIGFVQLRVDSISNCASETGGAAVCMTAEWSPTIADGVPGQGQLSFGLNAIRLVK